jgi:peptide/nickel transport system substrate-binding protein
MRRSLQWTPALGAALALSIGVAACGGGGGGGGGGSSEQGTSTGTPAKGKMGGKLTSLWAGDVDFIDPGETYYQMGLQVVRATQKTLYTPLVNDPTKPQPDMAESAPQISPDGCKVTIKLKQGVKFSPPVNRVVTSKDVKYAIERGFFNTVNNGYAGAYFGDLKGAKVGVKPGTTIPGITTPNQSTVVFNLKPRIKGRCTGGVLAGALTMPLSAPVPKDYAKKFDAKNPSAYGQNQVATGAYMVENNASGKAIGYQAGRRIHLVRNPNWDRSKDQDPAYVDEIDIQEGNEDTTVSARKILSGQSLISGDTPPPASVLRRAVSRQKDQLQIVPGGGGRWISLNMTQKPFDNLNVRRAISAGFDREALLLTRGGKTVGDIPTHYIPPGLQGFQEAGGYKGPGLDFMSKPGGDMQLAASYMKKAKADGVPVTSDGKYAGKQKLLMVSDNVEPGSKTADVAKQQFEKLGFNIQQRQVTHDAMYTKFCNVPSADVAICPNVGWIKDFANPQTFLDPTFNGDNILKQNNSNWSQLDNAQLNAKMNAAKTLTDPNQIAQAWADIDKQITSLAPAVMWIWDKTPNIESSNVQGVIDADNGIWALPYTSLK